MRVETLLANHQAWNIKLNLKKEKTKFILNTKIFLLHFALNSSSKH